MSTFILFNETEIFEGLVVAIPSCSQMESTL